MRTILRRIFYVQVIAFFLLVVALILDFTGLTSSKTSGAFPVLSLFSLSICLPLLGVTIIIDIIVVLCFLANKHK